MISSLELRHVVEMAFLPKRCVCTIDPSGSMTIQLFNEHTAQEELIVAGIDSYRLGSSRALAALVLELKEEVRLGHFEPERAKAVRLVSRA